MALSHDLFQDLIVGLAILVYLYASVEVSIYFLGKKPMRWLEYISNIFILLVLQLVRVFNRAWHWPLFYLIYEFSFFKIETTILSVVACYLIIDLNAYLWHRFFLHGTRLGWAFHVTHHSSLEFNTSIAGRLPWIQYLFNDFAYFTPFLLGFHPLMVIPMIEINRSSQFWLHTELIGKVPLIEGIFSTPSNHRVHHHRSEVGESHNYGSNFIFWDRLFGTYKPEITRHRNYGSALGDIGSNPFRIQFIGLSRYLWPQRRNAP